MNINQPATGIWLIDNQKALLNIPILRLKTMDDLNSDLILKVAQYVSVLDAAAWMQTSKRYYYLIHHLRHVMGPEMVAAASDTPVAKALSQLRQSPTLALCCSTESSTFNQQVASQLPPSTVVVGAVAQSIQTCADGEVESRSPANILLGHLGNEATVQPFVWESQGQVQQRWTNELETEVKATFAPDNEGGSSVNVRDYEVFILYGCGAGCGVLEEFIRCVQSMHPKAQIVGGICSSGYISKPVTPQQMEPGVLSSKPISSLKSMFKNMGGSDEEYASLTEKQDLVDRVHSMLKKHPFVVEPNLEDAVFGVALRGNIPIRSVVSRGVKKLTAPDTTLFVRETRLMGPTANHDWQQQEQVNPQNRTVIPAFHVIDSLVEKGSDRPWDFMSFLAQHGGEGVDFCGVRRRKPGSSTEDESYDETFELYALDMHGDKLKIPVNNSDLFSSRALAMAESEVTTLTQTATFSQVNEGDMDEAQIEFFALDGPACMEHVENTMKRLKEQTENNGDNVMAAMMFSCAGRGPMPGWLLTKPMNDATAFTNAFGRDIPCIGFYAGGEIGPLATAPVPGVQERDLFQRGRANLQGFTAVFALFLAPTVDLRHIEIDDSPEHIDAFISEQLHPNK